MMTLYLVVAFGIGVIGGVVGTRIFGQAPAPANPFVGDTPQADEMRSEAKASVAARTTRRHERILDKAKELGQITNDGVEDLFCISDRTATTYLNQLTEEGKLKKVGAGRGTHYLPR